MNFDDIYYKYVDIVYSYLRLKTNDIHLIEDIIQETFIILYQNYNRISEIHSLKPFILKIAHNKFVDKIRKNKYELLQDEDSEIIYEDDAIDGNVYINDILNILDDVSKDIIYSIYVEGFSYKEVSEMLNIPEGTVKSKCFYAKERLKKYLKEELYNGE